MFCAAGTDCQGHALLLSSVLKFTFSPTLALSLGRPGTANFSTLEVRPKVSTDLWL